MLARSLHPPGCGASRCFTPRWPLSSSLDHGSPSPSPRLLNRPSHQRRLIASKPASKQSLTKVLDSHSICYKRNSSLPEPLRKEDKHTLAAAHRFFIHPKSTTTNRFLYSAAQLSDHPANPCVPEVLVIGASNAGKSTFINALLGVPGVALVGQTPGSTMLQNVYSVGLPRDWDFRNLASWSVKPAGTGLYIVDSPGYGFGSARSFHDALTAYLEKRTACRGVVLLLPLNKEMRPVDTGVLGHLAGMNKRTIVLLTKADTAKSDWAQKWAQRANYIRDTMKRIDRKGSSSSGRWTEGEGWNPDIHVIAAGARGRTASSNTAGMGGARRAILELAGYNLKGTVAEEDPSVASYGGDIVPFDEIQYKG